MNKTINNGMPTANLAINKSRIKVYSKNSEMPTYYLQKGQEFQIELFNPTTDTILAKIRLNGNKIGQGGLVLRPGERVFLDRYIDVAKKFKFDTYEVSNSSEVKEAIKNNGDFKVEFFNEYIAPAYTPQPSRPWSDRIVYQDGNIGTGVNPNLFYTNEVKGLFTNINSTVTTNCLANHDFFDLGQQTLSTLSREVAPEPTKINPIKKLFKKKSKSIETGRVEEGSTSDQTMTIVYKDWLTIPFHTLEYKMLPESQKVNTVQDVQAKRYCTECGTKNKSTFKFCPNCGSKC